MKKIVCLIDDLCPGGAQRQLVGLACLLKENGYNVSVLTYHMDGFYKRYLLEVGIPHIYDASFESTVYRVPRIASQLRRLSPDVVIAYQESPSLIACCSRMLGGRFKLVVSERNTTQQIRFGDRIRFMLYKYADAIVPNSHSQESFLRQNYPSMGSKIRTITNFVDTEKFRIDICSEKKNRIVSVGRINPQKNILNYIQAAKQVIDQGFEVTFDWFGNTDMPEYEQACYGLIKELCMENHFVFHKAVTDIIPEYQKSLAFCLPSIYEGFPNVVCEAMSCGIPVLCSNVCDNPKIITSEQYGFLFNPNNVNDISKNIIRYLKLGKERTDKMGQNCRNVAITMFSKQTFVKQYIELIER